MPTVAARFESAMGNKLAGLLDMPDRDPKAYALFAHCFTCGKSLAAVRNISKMLTAEGIAGEAYNCYVMNIAIQDVAAMAQKVTGNARTIEYLNKGPKNQIITKKIRNLGLRFSGDEALERTVRELLKS